MKIDTIPELLSFISGKLVTKQTNGRYMLNVTDLADDTALTTLTDCVTDDELATTNAILDGCVTGTELATTNALLDGCVTGTELATTNALLDGCVTGTEIATTNALLDGCVTGTEIATTNALLDGCVTGTEIATTNAVLDACVTADAVATTNAIVDVALGADTGTANVTTASKTASFTPAVTAQYLVTLGQTDHATLGAGDTISIKQGANGIVTMAGTIPTGGPLLFEALGSYVAALIGAVAVDVVLTGENTSDVTVRFDRIIM